MIDIILLLFLVICGFVAVAMNDLLSTTIILGAYSLIMAIVWTRLNAVDVAFTEASVGAGITTVLIIAALSRTQRMEAQILAGGRSKKYEKYKVKRLLLLMVILVTGGILMYGTIDMPAFGNPNDPANLHVVPRYIKKTYEETGVVNFVTAILANYRGYDTLGETSVIFTAGLSVILLLRRKK